MRYCPLTRISAGTVLCGLYIKKCLIHLFYILSTLENSVYQEQGETKITEDKESAHYLLTTLKKVFPGLVNASIDDAKRLKVQVDMSMRRLYHFRLHILWNEVEIEGV